MLSFITSGFAVKIVNDAPGNSSLSESKAFLNTREADWMIRIFFWRSLELRGGVEWLAVSRILVFIQSVIRMKGGG